MRNIFGVLVATCCLIGLAASPALAAMPTIPLPVVDMMSAPRAPGMATTVDPTTAVDPTTVSFAPSADNDAVSPLDGAALVTRYEMRVYLQASPADPVATQDLGKPAVVNGSISAGLDPTSVVAKLLKDTLYVARIAAIGPRGEGLSGSGNPFGYAATTPPGAPGSPVIRRP